MFKTTGTILRFTMILIAFSTLIGCGKDDEPKEGCNDPEAENYDFDVEINNNTCVYLADAFRGNYIARDTAYDEAGEVAATRVLSFSVSKTGNKQIETFGFEIGGCEGTILLNLSKTSFVPLRDCSESNFIGKIEGTSLIYQYEFSINSMVTYSYSGVATKQE